MRRFCQNPHCDNPAGKVVEVSVDAAGDQKRSLCLVCEEAFSWGVQHGTIVARPSTPRIDAFLRRQGFVLLTHNSSDPSRHGPYEAWAYRGPLDFDKAVPVVFGVGLDIRKALAALDHQLKRVSRRRRRTRR